MKRGKEKGEWMGRQGWKRTREGGLDPKNGGGELAPDFRCRFQIWGDRCHWPGAGVRWPAAKARTRRESGRDGVEGSLELEAMCSQACRVCPSVGTTFLPVTYPASQPDSALFRTYSDDRWSHVTEQYQSSDSDNYLLAALLGRSLLDASKALIGPVSQPVLAPSLSLVPTHAGHSSICNPYTALHR